MNAYITLASGFTNPPKNEKQVDDLLDKAQAKGLQLYETSQKLEKSFEKEEEEEEEVKEAVES